MSNEAGQHQRFVVEAREHLAALTSALIALERGQGDPQAHFEQLLRSVHSVKGGAGFTGHVKIEQLAHTLETALENLRDGRTAATPDVIDALLSALDRIGAMVDDLEHSEEADISPVLVRLRSLIGPPVSGTQPQDPTTAAPVRLALSAASLTTATAQPGEFPLDERVLAAWRRAGFLYGVKLDWFECERAHGLDPLEVARRLELGGSVLDSRMDLGGPGLREGLLGAPLWYRAIVSSSLGPEQFAQRLGIPCAAIVRLERVESAPAQPEPPPTPAAPRPAPASPAAGSLRIPVTLIDRMMGLAGELVLVRNQALQSADPAMVQLRQLMRRLDSVTSELQDAALRMRMQPVGTLFDRFPRLVRDVARQLGKQIEIEITGAQVELDKTIIEILSDPLTHLVRNCCDHGIETPDERMRAGKPPTGRITLSASQQRGRILIEIRDDGRGLDREAIKRKAIERGVRRAEELEQFSDRQVFDLILMSGFSTAARVTDLSGRGVGMDVVKTNLEQIGGVLEIESAAGRGTAFTLSLPLTLAIVPSLLLRNDGQRYVLPLRDVEEIVLLDPQGGRAQIECSDREEVLRLRGRLLPVTRLGEALTCRPPAGGVSSAHHSARQRGVGEAHPTLGGQSPPYAVVVKVGSQRFGLVVEELLGSEEIVVKPLHPLLRPLAVYAGATILGDGSVALILSIEGLARHSGIAQRSIRYEAEAQLAAPDEAEHQTLLVLRYGAAELLALPLTRVRRVVTIRREQIERVGDRELVNIDGTAVNILRLDRFLNVSRCPDQETFLLVLPRGTYAPVGILASEIVDTPTLPMRLDTQAYQGDGVLGSTLINGHIAVFLDMDRLLEMWDQAMGVPRPALPGGLRKRILVVDDTQFFRQLIRTHLESAGYEVMVATHGRDALDRLAEMSFDLVVTDIEMPVMDGLTFARRVREDPALAGLPLLALTTLGGQENRERALHAGFDAYEIKLDRAGFLSCVAGLIERPRSTGIAVSGSPLTRPVA